MTIVEKLSDRGGFIYEAIMLVLQNNKDVSIPKLQWHLFQCGVYIKKPLLLQALSVMKEKRMLTHNAEEKPKTPAIVQP